jgi:two-component system OmpR family sensor kinase
MIADEHVTVPGDPDALRVLLGNLVDNALRYTPPEGRIDVSAALAGGYPYLEVSDSGPGIPEKDWTRVFDRFYRGETTREPGTGLGLAIVKTIADRHDARVTLDNSEKGGLRVRVVFSAAVDRHNPHPHLTGLLPATRPRTAGPPYGGPISCRFRDRGPGKQPGSDVA